MAKVPILQSSVSPRVAADPGLRIPDQSRFLENVAQGADQLRARTTQIAVAEQEEKATSARIGLTTDLNQFMMDAREDNDPETLPDRFKSYFSERLEQHASTLSPGIAETFKERSQLASQDFEVRVGNIATDARADRLLANTNRDLRNIVDGFATADTQDVRDELAANGVKLLDDLLASDVINQVQHEKLTSAFADDALNGLAGRMLDKNPGALLQIDSLEEFETMEQSDRLKWKAAAERETQRILREADQQRKAEQREYLATYDATVEAMKRGAPLSASALATVSDVNVDAKIDDPDLRQALKAQRDIAVAMQDDVAEIPSMSPEEMRARREEIDLDTTVSDTGDMAEFALKQDRLANLDSVITKTLQARDKDPAGTALQTSSTAMQAFEAYQSNPSPETFSAYKASLAQTYEDQGYAEHSQRLFPVSVAKSRVAEINHIAGERPEVAAQQIETLSQSMGDDGSRGLAELQSAGLDPLMSSVWFLTGSPGLQNQIVSIAKNGGVKAIKEQIDKDSITTVDEEIATAFEQTYRLGEGNGKFLSSMTDTAKVISYDLVRQGYSETEAVELATAAVLDSNFQPVEENRIRGLVDVEATIDTRLLGLGASEWFSDLAVGTALGEGPKPEPAFKVLANQTFLLGREGTREEDIQATARRILANSGRFELSPDGKTATLVDASLGMPQAIKDEDGEDIVISVSELEKLGRAKLAEDVEKRNLRAGAFKGDLEPDESGGGIR